jgi:hypothetical protein
MFQVFNIKVGGMYSYPGLKSLKIAWLFIILMRSMVNEMVAYLTITLIWQLDARVTFSSFVHISGILTV